MRRQGVVAAVLALSLDQTFQTCDLALERFDLTPLRPYHFVEIVYGASLMGQRFFDHGQTVIHPQGPPAFGGADPR